MSAGNFPLDLSGNGLPSMDDILAQMEGFSGFDPEMLDLINQYAMIVALQSQIGQYGLGMAQNELGMAQIPVQMEELGVRSEEAAARQAETQFRIEHELPFRLQQFENDQMLAELNLQLQQDRAQNERLSNAEELQQLRDRGSYDAKIQAIGLDTALVNLARQREAAAQSTGQRGSGQFTPRSIDSYGGIRY